MKPVLARTLGQYGIEEHPVNEHPRLVFDSFGPEEEEMVRYYLRQGKPFTVVLP